MQLCCESLYTEGVASVGVAVQKERSYLQPSVGAGRDGGWSCLWVWWRRQRFWYVLPDGSRQKRLGEAVSRSERSGMPTIFPAVFTVCWGVLQFSAAPTPHSDVSCQDVLDEGALVLRRRIIFPCQQYSVGCSSEVPADAHPKTLAAHPLHSSTADGLRDGWKMSVRTTLSSSTQAFQHTTRYVVSASSLATVDGGMFFSNWLVTGTKPGCGVGGVLCCWH